MVEIQKPPKNIDPAVYNYLYQLAEFLSMRIDTVEEHAQSAQLSAKKSAENMLSEGGSEYQALRSLIIKTADVVNVRESLNTAVTELGDLVSNLEKEYVAVSDFGEYLEKLNGTITLDGDGLNQFYKFVAELKANVEKVSAEFTSYRVDAEGYTRVGIVDYDEYSAPIWGLAVGRDLVVTETDEGSVIEKKNFRAIYTDSQLSFWQDGTKVAYMSNKQLYITNVVALNSLTVGKWEISTENGFTLKWIGG